MVYTNFAVAQQYPSVEQLPEVRELRNPLQWFGKDKCVTSLKEWQGRRQEIANFIQHYEIGTIPDVNPKKQMKARMSHGESGDTLFVDVTVGKKTLSIYSTITYPKTGTAPYALLIGTSHDALPLELLEKHPLALMDYNERQVNGYSQFRGDTTRTNYGFVRLYPELIDNGAYSEWIWGFSRLIDGLELLGPEVTKIDVKRIGATGCSYAGKMALFCGAFDQRVKLTIAQEPGGGGAAAWRVSHTLEGVEDLDKTDYHWFKHSLKEQFHDDNVYRLPYDHHELCAMVFPRALLTLGNPDYKWLADESMKVSMEKASEVWNHFGMGSKVHCSIVANHPHCSLPKEQYGIVDEFITKYLIESASTDK